MPSTACTSRSPGGGRARSVIMPTTLPHGGPPTGEPGGPSHPDGEGRVEDRRPWAPPEASENTDADTGRGHDSTGLAPTATAGRPGRDVAMGSRVPRGAPGGPRRP